MEKLAWAFAIASFLLGLIGSLDLLIAPAANFTRFVAGTYWKGAIMLILFAIFLRMSLLKQAGSA